VHYILCDFDLTVAFAFMHPLLTVLLSTLPVVHEMLVFHGSPYNQR